MFQTVRRGAVVSRGRTEQATLASGALGAAGLALGLVGTVLGHWPMVGMGLLVIGAALIALGLLAVRAARRRLPVPVVAQPTDEAVRQVGTQAVRESRNAVAAAVAGVRQEFRAVEARIAAETSRRLEIDRATIAADAAALSQLAQYLPTAPALAEGLSVPPRRLLIAVEALCSGGSGPVVLVGRGDALLLLAAALTGVGRTAYSVVPDEEAAQSIIAALEASGNAAAMSVVVAAPVIDSHTRLPAPNMTDAPLPERVGLVVALAEKGQGLESFLPFGQTFASHLEPGGRLLALAAAGDAAGAAEALAVRWAAHGLTPVRGWAVDDRVQGVALVARS